MRSRARTILTIIERRIEIPDQSWISKVDDRYASTVKDEYKECIRDVKKYLSDPEGETLAEYSEGRYKCVVTRDSRKLYFRDDLEAYPVPAGSWMDWYEKDWKSRYGISSKDYLNLSTAKRAEIECKEQVNNWITDEYEGLFLEFYFPERYGKWFWDEEGREGGSRAAHRLFKELVG